MTIDIIELYPGRAIGIERILQEGKIAYQLLKAYKVELPPSTNNPLILSGGTPSLLEKELFPYLENVVKYVYDAIDKGVPILGICLGHQVIAKALGGTIALSRNPEYGFQRVVHIENELTREIASPFLVFQYHKDEVISLPSNTDIFSSSESTRIQGFSIKRKKVYGVQYHPEVNLSLAKQILENNPHQNQVGSYSSLFLNDSDILGDKIIKNFLEVL